MDGREYIDYCLAFGPLIAGHGHPRVIDAVLAEIARAGTLIFGAPRPGVRPAERLAAVVPSAEMVRFTSSGTEGPTLHALRLARGATGGA